MQCGLAINFQCSSSGLSRFQKDSKADKIDKLHVIEDDETCLQSSEPMQWPAVCSS